jgi:hypothetical protein
MTVLKSTQKLKECESKESPPSLPTKKAVKISEIEKPIKPIISPFNSFSKDDRTSSNSSIEILDTTKTLFNSKRRENSCKNACLSEGLVNGFRNPALPNRKNTSKTVARHHKIPKKGKYSDIARFMRMQKVKKIKYFAEVKRRHYENFLKGVNKRKDINLNKDEQESIMKE